MKIFFFTFPWLNSGHSCESGDRFCVSLLQIMDSLTGLPASFKLILKMFQKPVMLVQSEADLTARGSVLVAHDLHKTSLNYSDDLMVNPGSLLSLSSTSLSCDTAGRSCICWSPALEHSVYTGCTSRTGTLELADPLQCTWEISLQPWKREREK